MRYFHDNNQLFGAFKIGDISYPANWLQFATDEEKSAIGIVTLQDEVPPEPTFKEILEKTEIEFNFAIQNVLDKKAIEFGYDNITSACSYAGATNPFQEESKSFITWRGDVWNYCIGELTKVKNGTRPLPDLEAFLTELPVFRSATPSLWKKLFG